MIVIELSFFVIVILVDTLGLLLAIVVHPADIQDRDGAKIVFQKINGIFIRLVLIRADGGYAGKLIEWVNSIFKSCRLEIVPRCDKVKGFKILPHRWIVERYLWVAQKI